MHDLDSHLEFFPENNGVVSDEHGKRFHQDFKLFEKRHQGNISSAIMAEFCWSLRRDSDEDLSKKRRCPQHF